MESDCSPSAEAIIHVLRPEVPCHSDQSSVPCKNPSENSNITNEDDEETEKRNGNGEEEKGGLTPHSLAPAPRTRVSTADGMAFGAAFSEEDPGVDVVADARSGEEKIRKEEVKKGEEEEASASSSTLLKHHAPEFSDQAHGNTHEGDEEIDPRPNVPPRTAAVLVVVNEACTERESPLDMPTVGSRGGSAEEQQHTEEYEERKHAQQSDTHTTLHVVSKRATKQTNSEKETSERAPPDDSLILRTHTNKADTMGSSRGGSPKGRDQGSSVSKGLSTSSSMAMAMDDNRDVGDDKRRPRRQRKGEQHQRKGDHQDQQHVMKDQQHVHHQHHSHARLLGQEGAASIEVYKQSEVAKNFWVNRLHLLRREVEAARLKAHMKRSIGEDNRESAELIKATTASQLEAERRRAEAHLDEKADAIRRQREAKRVAFKASLHQTIKVRLDGGRAMRAEAQQQRSIVQQLREEVLLSKKASREKVIEEKNKAAERRQKEREVRELKSSTLYTQRLTRLREKAEHNEQETRTLVEESGQLLEQLRQLSSDGGGSSPPHHTDDLHNSSI